MSKTKRDLLEIIQELEHELAGLKKLPLYQVIEEQANKIKQFELDRDAWERCFRNQVQLRDMWSKRAIDLGWGK